MAGMEILCSDKTGTLTQNKLTLGEIVPWGDVDPQDVLLAAYAAHPERFVQKPPSPHSLPEAVWINPPTPSSEDHEKGLPKTVGSQKPDAPSAHPRSGYPSPGCVPAEPGSVSPDTLKLPESVLKQHPPSDTRVMPKKIPGVWGLAPTSKENCSRSESTLH